MWGSTNKRRHSRSSSPELPDKRVAPNRRSVDAIAEKLDRIGEIVNTIIEGSKKRRMTFSTVSLGNLYKAGVQMKFLSFEDAEITNLTSRLTRDAKAQIRDLRSRIKDIYKCVNVNTDSRSRMILEAILLTVRKVASTQQTDIAIIPEMSIGEWDGDGDGVQICHPVSGYELELSGKADYAVFEYENIYKGYFLGHIGFSGGCFQLAKGRLLLVHVKHLGPEDRFIDRLPEAVSQAIALLKSANLPEVRFCLSDGEAWIFFVLKLEDNMFTYYESGTLLLRPDCNNLKVLPLREMVSLLCEWLRPTATGLFTVG